MRLLSHILSHIDAFIYRVYANLRGGGNLRAGWRIAKRSLVTMKTTTTKPAKGPE